MRPVIPEPVDGPALRHLTLSGGLRVALHDWGNPSAPPLLLIHGGRDHARGWDWAARRLRSRFHVLCPDLRGHGDSDWQAEGRYRAEDYVLDLASLIEREALAPLSIIGHSLGGNIALRYTAAFPESVLKLVVIEGLGPSPTRWAERNARPADEVMRNWLRQALKAGEKGEPRRLADMAEAEARMRAAHPSLDEARIAHLVQHGVRRRPDGGFGWKHDARMMVENPTDLSEDQHHQLWAAIRCPTLLIYGTAGWASNPIDDGRAARFPAAEVALVAGAGHWVQHDRFEAVMALVDRFF